MPSPLSPTTIEGKSRLLADYLRESLYPRLEARTRGALERGVEATLPGDEGYAAWLQYREIKVGEILYRTVTPSPLLIASFPCVHAGLHEPAEQLRL